MNNNELLVAILHSHPGISVDEAIQYYEKLKKGTHEIDRKLLLDSAKDVSPDAIDISVEQSAIEHAPKYTKKDLKLDPNKSICADEVICCLCNKSFKSIRDTHFLKNHGISKEEYLDLCGLPRDTKLTCQSLIDARRKSALDNNLGRKNVIESTSQEQVSAEAGSAIGNSAATNKSESSSFKPNDLQRKL